MSHNQEQLCKTCGRQIRQGVRFCSHCGTAAPNEEHEEYVAGTNSLRTLLWLYGSLLVFIVFIRLLKFVSGAGWNFMVDILFSLIIFRFALRNRNELRPLLSFKNISVLKVLITIGVSVIFAGLVLLFSGWLKQTIFHSGVFSEEYLFDDTAYPLLFSILSIAVQPAIFEEIGFRGLIYDQLNKAGGPQAALLVSSFMFAILHLSIISLLWLVPIGLALGWMRQRYNTLWYGMIAHFCYNVCVVLYNFLTRG
ncbi:MAG TPA: CPBP family intramembrane glutamic endopeptidase [Bacteroidia bacterium]|jgi:membrane protease YdiL (CAAX protease family)|nr:CPBP family intramembrane glutamic endopeptidase [Bacteroidia bacterium]